MQYLFDNELRPITWEIGLIDADEDTASRTFVDWQSAINRVVGVRLASTRVTGGLRSVLSRLLPLTNVERRRYLFVSTTSKWTAFFDNGHLGTDAMSVMSYLAKNLNCRAIRAVAIPEKRMHSSNEMGGSVILEVYGPHDGDFLNYLRSISVTNDGGRWVFDMAGVPQSFEDQSYYRKKRVRDRFTPELLSLYLAKLGLYPFEESFYATEHVGATLIEKQGPLAPDLQEFFLESNNLTRNRK